MLQVAGLWLRALDARPMARDIRPHVVSHVGSSASKGYLGHRTVPNPGRGHVLSVLFGLSLTIRVLLSIRFLNPTWHSLNEIDVL